MLVVTVGLHAVRSVTVRSDPDGATFRESYLKELSGIFALL